jgi:hypothetical protein
MRVSFYFLLDPVLCLAIRIGKKPVSSWTHDFYPLKEISFPFTLDRIDGEGAPEAAGEL